MTAGKRNLINAAQPVFRRWCAKHLIHQSLQPRVGHLVQSQRGLTHLADPTAHQRHLLRAKIRMVTERGFQFVNRLGGDPRRQRLVETFEYIVDTFPAIGRSLQHSSRCGQPFPSRPDLPRTVNREVSLSGVHSSDSPDVVVVSWGLAAQSDVTNREQVGQLRFPARTKSVIAGIPVSLWLAEGYPLVR